jgi:hypothetical protein
MTYLTAFSNDSGSPVPRIFEMLVVSEAQLFLRPRARGKSSDALAPKRRACLAAWALLPFAAYRFAAERLVEAAADPKRPSIERIEYRRPIEN